MQKLMGELGDSVHEVTVPGGMEPAAWAREYALSPPRICPDGWPESTLMCLMVVYRQGADFDQDSDTVAVVVTRPEAMHALATGWTGPQLWFRLPRRIFSPDVCPTLKPEHWPEDTDPS